MTFADGMKAERERLKISQKELSIRSNVSQQAISAIECGANKPTEETMVMIAKGLGCTVGKLLGELDAKNEPAISSGELRRLISILSRDLTDSDFQRIEDFATGLKAAHKPSPDPVQ